MSMAVVRTIAGALGLTVLAQGPISAAVIDFDDLAHQEILTSYAGLEWQNFRVMDLNQSLGGPGYLTGAVSPPNTIYNRFAAPAEFYTADGSPFILGSLYLTAAWYSDLEVSIEGFQNGVVTHARDVIIDPSGPENFFFNWAEIDRVRFATSGGIAPEGPVGARQLVLDNLVLGEVTIPPIPLPAGLPLLLTGLAGLALLRRRAA